MSSKKPKILMLGWEFPPVINGGLGVACHDLCIALNKHARVTMVIPKTYPDFSIENLELIGLNTIDARTLRNISYKNDYKEMAEVHYVPSRLNPYYNETYTRDELLEIKSKYLTQVDVEGETAEVFNIEDLYGGDVIEKVTVFGKLTAKLAMKLNFDVIHAHDWMTMAAGMEIKAKTGKPLVMHIHSRH